ncbi:MAG: hypothetical protein EXS67_06200 [Candidatus Margulisbacteria bacterium]|nr:hypothetical protein [Candidatus Margulisiibacteriota bacterium]
MNSELIKSLLHLDTTLYSIIQTYHDWTHALLFLIVFCETGLVFTPFLPGDSLLFVAGSFAAKGLLNHWLLYVLLLIASITGNMINYTIGRQFSSYAAKTGKIPFVKKEYIERTQHYYEKHGFLTLILTRFIPILRTMAPFLAGVSKMSRPHFFFYTVSGAFLWISIFYWGGYLFGNIPIVKDHFNWVVIGIVLVSFLPPIHLYIRSKRK